MINSTVSGNSPAGLFNYNVGTATLTNSTVSGNSGLGVDNYGTATLMNSTVSGNNSGVSNFGTLTLGQSTITENTYCGIVNGRYDRPTSLATVCRAPSQAIQSGSATSLA